MRTKLAVVAALLVLAGTAYIAWRNEWLVSTPASILKRSLMQANAGDYEAACQNLPTGQRDQLLGNPQLRKEVWDRITKKRTIDSIQVIREDRGVTGTFGDIDITIRYLDGSAMSARTKISYLHDRWSFGVAEIDEAVLAQDRKRAGDEFQKWQIVLAKDYSRVGKSDVFLRIPEGLIWDPDRQAYDHPKYQILIHLGARIPSSFSALARFVEQQWDSSTRVLERREDLSRGKVKAVLFDGDAVNEKGRGWRCMDLIIGDEHQATLISTTFPKLDNFRRAMRECLTSARWDSTSSR
jgi:hypothetical protein